MTPTERVYLAMGKASDSKTKIWKENGGFDHYLTLESAAPHGRRFGSRVLGLGIDSAVLAVKARVKFGKNQQYVCANPWTAVALRFTGVHRFSVTGIYAIRGTQSWKVLRRAIRQNPVLTLVAVEAAEWNADGGNAKVILYGNTYDYPCVPKSSQRAPLTIFVGGTSDRDAGLLNRVVEEVREASDPVRLVVADGTGPRQWSNGSSTVEHMPFISNEQFGILMSTCDVVFLPIANSQRAAGHMVTVGALECGLKVVSSVVSGMSGYIDGRYVIGLDPRDSILKQLRNAAGDGTRESRNNVHDYWDAEFSLHAYAARVGSFIQRR